ncbi:MAG TPA: hypothetical protein VL595_21625, partial [Pseudonocardia sp.]|nr:hypothetical protein [Pseudonocardia sp.]
MTLVLLVVVAAAALLVAVVVVVPALRTVVGTAAGTPAERAHLVDPFVWGNDLRGAVAWNISADLDSVSHF